MSWKNISPRAAEWLNFDTEAALHIQVDGAEVQSNLMMTLVQIGKLF